jgi:hypothetical protein
MFIPWNLFDIYSKFRIFAMFLIVRFEVAVLALCVDAFMSRLFTLPLIRLLTVINPKAQNFSEGRSCVCLLSALTLSVPKL